MDKSVSYVSKNGGLLSHRFVLFSSSCLVHLSFHTVYLCNISFLCSVTYHISTLSTKAEISIPIFLHCLLQTDQCRANCLVEEHLVSSTSNKSVVLQ
ncbi:unnamed protein product, partial [Candidula unifasciata]